MNETTTNTKQYAPGKYPDLPAPIITTGAVGWVRTNLLSSPLNIILTVVAIWFLWTIIPPMVEWMFLDAVWSAGSRTECWAKMAEPEAAACWAFIQSRFSLFIYGFYPEELRWRVNLSFVLLILAIVPVLYDKAPGRKYGIWYSAAFPLIAAWLLVGGLGLTPVETDRFGGIMLTLIIGVTG
ncbi:MAG: amino acid ABC transporter permease, partial [Gammaproteobacteria bacterium]|nr:amino acid ABC transporter permease [Gammaproteobacteria bacterium]